MKTEHISKPHILVLPDKPPVPDKSCNTIVQDIHDILAQINRYLQMKSTSSTVDIFFYIERSIRANALCQQLTSSFEISFHDELVMLHQAVKDRWQHDHQLIATPSSLHTYLKDDGRDSIKESKIII